MHASFEFTPEDLLALSQYHETRSQTLLGIRGCSFAVIGAMLFLPMFIFLTSEKPFLETAMAIRPLLVMPVFMVVFAVPYMLWRKAYITRTLTEGQNNAFYGDCTVALDAAGIRVTKASGETFRRWSSVQKLAVTNSHLFVYTAGIEAIIIPRRAFDTSAFNDFVEFITDHSGVHAQNG